MAPGKTKAAEGEVVAGELALVLVIVVIFVMVVLWAVGPSSPF